MPLRIRTLLFCALAATAALSAAELPYAGKWKLNPAKSDFGQTTITYTQLPSGEMQSTAEGQSYKFKLDEKDYPDPFGNTAAWKSIDANTWQTTWKLNGKVLFVDTLKVSSDGKSLTINTKGTKPNGEAMDDTIVLQRVSGTAGLTGQWKTKNYKSSSPEVLELASSGSDGLTVKVVDVSLTCDAKVDGKDHPCTGPTLASGWTIAIAKAGPGSLGMTTKRNGKTLFKSTYTVSDDGKTLTESGSAVGINEKLKAVYDRQ